ncbi:TonB-dependent receptor [Sphingomonas koreensis]|nr:TonB-dependent receptor [Sphingomonas koreensis]
MRAAAWGAGLILAAYPALAVAQQAPPSAGAAQADDAADDYADPADDIVVTGKRQVEPGAVIGDIPPELQLRPADIRSYGVSTIADLLAELAPQTQSGRGGSPAVLLSGKRIADFREIRDLPTEAILRVDILPEQVALKYGFSADQKVVNIVLRRHFHSVILEGRDGQPTDGGRNNPRGQFDLVNITPAGRLSLDLDYQQSAKLLESQRSLTGDAVGPTGEPTPIGADQLSRYRTLLPATHEFAANAVYARSIFGDVSATLNGAVEVSDSSSDQGLPLVTLDIPAHSPFSSSPDAAAISRYVDLGGPLTQSSQAITSHIGTTFNGMVGSWNWSLIGNYDRTDSKTFTDTGVDASALQAAIDAGDPSVDPFGTIGLPLIQPGMSNYARSISNSGKVDALITGAPLSLPAGKVSTSLHLGAHSDDFTSRSIRYGIAQSGDVSRDLVNGRLNVDLPIASRSKHVLSALGNLSANFNVAVDQLSDFGTLTEVGYGVNWTPVDAISALVSFTDKDDAPTAEQLGNPLVTTPNSRVFDYITGQTIDIARISGGNPDLAADTRHIFQAELNVKPFAKADLRLTASYTATRTTNEIADLPAPTSAIEAAFPDRFMRDSDGMLTGIDARPVNFDEENSKQLRWGFNFSQPIKSKMQKAMAAYRNGDGPDPLAEFRHAHRPDDAGAPPPPPPGSTTGQASATGAAGGASSPPGGGRHGGFGRHGGGGFGRGAGGGGGRLQFAVYHTWRLEDQVHIRDGLPLLDLLNGGSSGVGGGQPRHEIEVQAGYSNNGLGVRLSADWQSGTHVDGGSGAMPRTLDFSPLTTVDLRLFADLGNQRGFVQKHPWARGMRVTLSAKNLFNSRQDVTDQAGQTPVNYQPDYLDPFGRTVMISVRKLFFQRSAQ